MSSSRQTPGTELSDEQVRPFLDKHLLMGITHCDMNGEVSSLEQFHGRIVRINLAEGLVLRLPSGDERSIPPDFARLEPASPGVYRLRGTGEVVSDPDFTVMWTRYPKGYGDQPRN